MRRIHSKEAAAVGSQHLHWDKGSQWPYHDRLLLGLIVIVRAHRGSLERVDLIIALVGHRHALNQEHHAKDEDRGQERVEDNPPHIQEEVADVLVAAEGSNNRCESAEANRRGEKEHRQAKEYLGEIRERLVAGIMLDVGVGA